MGEKMAKGKMHDTKLSILHCAMKLFLEKGYTEAYITTISKRLNISTGNLTFHFPTKEHLLAEIVKELFEFQSDVRVKEKESLTSPIISYLRELIIVASMCEENPEVKDLVTAAYTHSMALDVIRVNDARRAAERFVKYCKDWTTEDFIRAENVVSGIEYAMLMTENAQMFSLEQRVSGSLDAILMIYQVPEADRRELIKEVLMIDYRNVGRRVFEGFCNYVKENRDDIV